MPKRGMLLTVRLAADEKGLIDQYLRANPLFESFSSLVRVATLAFIETTNSLPLRTVARANQARRPSFLWDYDLTEAAVREILWRSGLTDDKRWLIARILNQARFEEVLSYLSVAEIERALPMIRISAKVRERWSYALARWKTRVS